MQKRGDRLVKRKINEAWSRQIDRKEEKEKRKEKKGKKREWLKKQHEGNFTASGLQKSTLKRGCNDDKNPSADDGDDWVALQREERMAKKVRQGQIEQQDFDREFGDLDG